MSLFKIIIPTFNCENTIEKTLSSIQSQSMSDFSAIIVDDMSTDNTVEKILKFIENKDNFIFLKLDQKGYAGGARQKGIEYDLDSKYTWFVDGDDFLLKNSLELANSYFSSNDIDLLLYETVCFNGEKYFMIPSNRNYQSNDIRLCKHNQPWSRVVKTQYAGSFFNGNFMEDNFNFITELEQIDYFRILSINNILYINYLNPNSVTRSYCAEWKTRNQCEKSLKEFSNLKLRLTKPNLISSCSKIIEHINETLHNRSTFN